MLEVISLLLLLSSKKYLCKKLLCKIRDVTPGLGMGLEKVKDLDMHPNIGVQLEINLSNNFNEIYDSVCDPKSIIK